MTKNSTVTNTSEEDKIKTIDDKKKGDLRVDGALIGKKSRLQTPPFLLTFKFLIAMFTIVLLILGLHQM